MRERCEPPARVREGRRGRWPPPRCRRCWPASTISTGGATTAPPSTEEQRLVQSLLARAPERLRRALARRPLLFLGQRRSGRCRSEQRSRWGKDGWDIAEHAIAVNPNDVAGYYWAAVCMGNYALGLGVVKALSQGHGGEVPRSAGAGAGAERRLRVRAASRPPGGASSTSSPGRSATARRPRSTCAGRSRSTRRRCGRGSIWRARTSTATARRRPSGCSTRSPRAPVGRYDAPEERRAKALAHGLQPELATPSSGERGGRDRRRRLRVEEVVGDAGERRRSRAA